MLREMQEIQALAIKYSKADLGRMVQLNLLDPQKAMMAGMMIQRIEQQNAKPPQTTAIQDVLGLPAVPNQPPQQPQPQMPPQGVAALPPQGAPSAGVAALPSGIKEMAGGGIVAFDEGGEVPGYAGDEGSVVTSSPIGRALTDFFGGRQYDSDTQQQLNDLNQQFQSLAARRKALTGTFGFQQQTREQQAEAAQIKQQMDAIWQQSQALKSGKPATTTPAVPTTDIPAPPAAAVPAPPAPPVAPTTGGKATTGGGGVPEFRPPSIKRPEINIPDFSGLKPETYAARPVQDLKDIGKERTDYMKSLGIDPEMYTKMLEKEEGKRGELAKRKSEAKGEALMMAGLGLLGAREGQEFQALSESGAKGLAQLRESYKELRASEERLDDRANALRIADQQAKQSGAEKDIAKRDQQQTLFDTAQKEAIKDRNSFATKRAELGMQGANIKTQAELSLYGTDTQAALQQQQIQIQRQQAANQAAYYSKSLQLTEARMKQMDAATQARLGKLKLDAGKMWEGSDESRRLMGALKQKYGDNFMNVPAAQMQLDQAKKAYIGYYLDQNDALIHAATDESRL